MRPALILAALAALAAGCGALPVPEASSTPPARPVITTDDLRNMVAVYQAHGVEVGDLGPKGQSYLALACVTAAMVPTRLDAQAAAACTLAHAIGTENGALAPILAPPPAALP